MELNLSLFLITLLFLSLLLTKIYKQKIKVKSKLPPGPRKLPLIGNLHQLSKACAGSLPHYALRNLANKYGPLMHLQLGELSAVIVSSPDMAKEIMKTHDLAFASRPKFQASEVLAYGQSNIVFAPYGDYWKQMKKLFMSEFLSVKKVQSFSPIREEEAARVIQTINSSAGASAPINFRAMVNSLLTTFLSRAAFGAYQPEISSLVTKSIGVLDGIDIADMFPSFKPLHFISGLKATLVKMHEQIDVILDKIVKENQSNEGGENVVKFLLRVQQSSTLETPIAIHNVKASMWDILISGADTTGTTIEWAMSEMMRNPRVLEKAQTEIREALRGKETVHESDIAELSYLNSVVRETLRLHPPVPLLVPRECREACKIGDYDIPINTKVMVNVFAIGRDPAYWYDAERFIPERFLDNPVDFRGNNFEFIPFGAGRRICPGISFALANIKFTLATILFHFNWELPYGMKPEELDMEERSTTVLGKKNSLHLIPIPYNPSIHDNGN